MILGNQEWAEGCDVVGVHRDGNPEVVWELCWTISPHFCLVECEIAIQALFIRMLKLCYCTKTTNNLHLILNNTDALDVLLSSKRGFSLSDGVLKAHLYRL